MKRSLPKYEIPDEVSHVAKTLGDKGFEAYLVGGCVRDLLINKKPKDWDFTTNATPEQIIASFPKTFYENDYGTVGVVNETTEDETLKVIEVTPYRLEAKYSNSRHPDSVAFSKNLSEDLKRRDFTCNAIAFKIGRKLDENTYSVEITDPFGGIEDINKSIIKAVGNPKDRFDEDALRILRAVRLAAETGFTINKETMDGIVEIAQKLKLIAKERIRDEFVRIIMSDRPMEGLIMAEKLGILEYIAIPLKDSVGIKQNQAHSYDVWEHTLRALQHSADKKFPLETRLSSLLHDIGKPPTREFSHETNDWTFYGHDVVGAKITTKILADLKFPKKIIDKVVNLVRWHMFFSDTDVITLSAVRRLVAKVGKENVWDLMDVRICDRIGTGRPKESPYRLRKYRSMIEEVMRDPISVSMLNIKGGEIMEICKLPPGKKIGFILNALLEEIMDNPELNTKEYLGRRAVEMSSLPEAEIEKLGEKGKDRKEKEEEKTIQEIRKKYYVK